LFAGFCQRRALIDAEAVLFVQYHQIQIFKFRSLLDQGVGAD